MTKIEFEDIYVRCRFCDSSWFLGSITHNIYKNNPKIVQFNCPACNHIQTSRKFNTDKIEDIYVRCRFCDSSWFLGSLTDNIYKNDPKIVQFDCPACGNAQTSRKFNTDKEDLPDNLKGRIK